MGKLKVYTSMTTTNNSPSQDYIHLDNQITLSHVTLGLNHFLYESGVLKLQINISIWTTAHLPLP